MTYKGHTISFKVRKGLYYLCIDGKRAADIEPAKYKGVLYRRLKSKYARIFEQEQSHG